MREDGRARREGKVGEKTGGQGGRIRREGKEGG